MVVDACFIASQIDVWTQAYNGPTSRRKYVLNLLNVLHKNVTEEYKTDQFLHVIYWFLIYKSNLGHFFRNEGTSPPPFLPLLFLHQLLWHRPCLLVRSVGLPPPGHAQVTVWVGHTPCLAAHVDTCLHAQGLQILGTRDRAGILPWGDLSHWRLNICREALWWGPRRGTVISQIQLLWDSTQRA